MSEAERRRRHRACRRARGYRTVTVEVPESHADELRELARRMREGTYENYEEVRREREEARVKHEMAETRAADAERDLHRLKSAPLIVRLLVAVKN